MFLYYTILNNDIPILFDLKRDEIPRNVGLFHFPKFYAPKGQTITKQRSQNALSRQL